VPFFFDAFPFFAFGRGWFLRLGVVTLVLLCVIPPQFLYMHRCGFPHGPIFVFLDFFSVVAAWWRSFLGCRASPLGEETVPTCASSVAP